MSMCFSFVRNDEKRTKENCTQKLCSCYFTCEFLLIDGLRNACAILQTTEVCVCVCFANNLLTTF